LIAHHGETREQRIQQFQTEHKIPVVGLRENGWLEIHDSSIELGGSEPKILFEANKEPEHLGPGTLSESTRAKLFNLSNIKTKLV
jgi:dipeptidase E